MNEELTKRSTARSPFAKKIYIGFKGVGVKLILVLTFVLITLPLFTTFNEILTKVAEKTGIYSFLSKNVVPAETRAVSLILRPFGITSRPSDTYLHVSGSGRDESAVYFSWNCLGWQSVVLLILTLITGLSGNYPFSRKIEVLVLGVSGTFLINLARICTIVLVSYYWGYLPGRLVHDYFGTLFTIVWFFFYWWFSYKYIIEK